MKSASTLLLAGVATAYEYGYVSKSSSSKIGYTTITPGGTYAPVTVTTQYQPVPTYISSLSDYSSYAWVSTHISDYDGHKCTITKTEQPVVVYHSKSTITHTTTTTDYGYAAPTGSYGKKNATATYTKTWEELYEKVEEAEYKDLGPSALPHYPGSGLCEGKCYGDEDTKYQPVIVKEYKNGKWSSYGYTHTYGAPKPSATTYAAPGTYTIPSYDMTVKESTAVATEATYTAPAGETVTYGGSSTYITKPTTCTAAYAAYETEGDMTKTVVKYVTITATKPGKYEVAKPTTTAYPTEHACVYPTAVVYAPGVYHHDPETVTISKSGEAYTCSYHQTSTYTPSPSAYATASSTTPYGPDPSSDYEEPAESYGHASAGYVKRGGMLKRRDASADKKAAPVGKRVILV